MRKDGWGDNESGVKPWCYHHILATRAIVFLVIFSWLTLCFWVTFKHLINTISMTKFDGEELSTGPTSWFASLHQDLKWFGNISWPLVVCVVHQAQCAAHWVCIVPLRKLNGGQAVCAPQPLCASRSWVYALCPPKPTLTHLNSHDFTLSPLQCLSKSCKSTMALIWAKTSIYRLGRDGFDFFFLENPFSNVEFCTFFIDFKTHWFSLFLWHFGSNNEIFGISLRGLYDWAFGHGNHDCI